MRLKIPIWIIFTLLIISFIFFLRYYGLLIKEFYLLFLFIWFLVPIFSITLIFSKTYKRFNSKNLKYFKAISLIFVVSISFFSLAKFSDYSNGIDKFCIEKYGENSSFSKNSENMYKELAKDFPELENIKESEYKDINGNDIYFKTHTNLSKIIFKIIVLLFAVFIFLIPISTWKLNDYIETYYEL